MLSSRKSEIESLIDFLDQKVEKEKQKQITFQERIRSEVRERIKDFQTEVRETENKIKESISGVEEELAKAVDNSKVDFEKMNDSIFQRISEFEKEIKVYFGELQNEMGNEIHARQEMENGICDLMKCIVQKVSDQLEEEKVTSEEVTHQLLNQLEESLLEVENLGKSNMDIKYMSK